MLDSSELLKGSTECGTFLKSVLLYNLVLWKKSTLRAPSSELAVAMSERVETGTHPQPNLSENVSFKCGKGNGVKWQESKPVEISAFPILKSNLWENVYVPNELAEWAWLASQMFWCLTVWLHCSAANTQDYVQRASLQGSKLVGIMYGLTWVS